MFDVERNISDDKKKKGVSIDGRLFPDDLLYCEGAERPLFRGVLHLLCTLILPLGYFDLLNLSNNNVICMLSSIFYVSTNIFCYGFSALFHVGRWSPKIEILIQKLDHCGIAILSTGTIVPVSFLLLPWHLGSMLFGFTFLSCIWTCRSIMKCKPSVLKQVITAGILALFVPSLYFIMNLKLCE